MTQPNKAFPDRPQKDILLHNRTSSFDDDSQRIWWDAMVRLSDVFSLAMQGAIERTTGNYRPMLYTEFLSRLYRVITTERICGQGFVFDDFVQIAQFSVPALKHIVSIPSTQIVKDAEKVHISQLHQTGSKTMQWISKRPGRSVQEKIAPSNNVLTSVTHFTADTKENREAIYLYNILYDMLRVRLKDVDCLSCEHATECGIPTKDIRDLLSLHNKIRNGEMSEVKADKQTIQNNKLMCDKYYKMVWDAVIRLSRIEDKLDCDWIHLKERYLQLGYWIVLAFVLHETDTSIVDSYGVLSNENGIICFRTDNGKSKEDWDAIPNNTRLFPIKRSWQPVDLYLNGNEIVLFDVDSNSEIAYYDATQLLDNLYKPEV